MAGLSADRLKLTRGRATLLADLSVAFPARGAVAVIGPNGAGKSMLLKLLAGIETPSAGRVRIGERDLAGLPPAERAKTIGYLPQHFQPHWDLAVAELVRLGAARAGGATDGLADAAIAAFALTELRHRRWSTLSGGERARVLLAMLLAVDPPILLADEPNASLDVRHRLDVVRTLTARGRDRLSVVVMHDLDLTFRYFQRVILMHRGRIVADGPAAAVVEDPRLDEAFGIRFERRRSEHGCMLVPL